MIVSKLNDARWCQCGEWDEGEKLLPCVAAAVGNLRSRQTL